MAVRYSPDRQKPIESNLLHLSDETEVDRGIGLHLEDILSETHRMLVFQCVHLPLAVGLIPLLDKLQLVSDERIKTKVVSFSVVMIVDHV